jgi:hypothetical protein
MGNDIPSGDSKCSFGKAALERKEITQTFANALALQGICRVFIRYAGARARKRFFWGTGPRDLLSRKEEWFTLRREERRGFDAKEEWFTLRREERKGFGAKKRGSREGAKNAKGLTQRKVVHAKARRTQRV